MVDDGTYRRLAALAHASHQLAAVGSVDAAFDSVSRLTLDLIEGASVSLTRLDPARGVVRVLRNVGDLASWEEERPKDETYPLADFPQLTVDAERATAWFGTLLDPGLREPERRLLGALGKQAMLIVPLVVDRDIWGALAVFRGKGAEDFTAEDLAASEALAGMVGSTLARMEERSALEALAYRDALTGLGNRRSVDDRLEAVFERDPLPTPVAAILCDVNGLKAVNDDQGHPAGDRLLRDVARILATEIGHYPGALAARIGGDEFCLVVEGVDDVELEAITRRVTHAAEQLELGGGLSCGFAVARQRPGDAPSAYAAARALLRLADAAQYRVKRAGRDVRSHSSRWEQPERSSEEVTAEVIELALLRLRETPQSTVDRLSAVATALHDVTDAAAWAVSRSIDGGPLTIERNRDRVRLDERGARTYQPGVAFELEDYPASRTALAGEAFHATLISGDHAERGFLAASGYAEIIGAGTTVDREGWLVEVCGDELSAPLVGLGPIAQVLVELAVAECRAINSARSASPSGSSV